MKGFTGTKMAAIYILVAATVSAMALPSAWKQFSATYGVKDGSNLATAKCTVCHTSMKGKTLNAYGKDIDAILKAAGTKKVSEQALHEVESKASGNGGSYISRIRADKLP